MLTALEAYEEFGRLMNDEEVFRDSSQTFEGLCRMIGIDKDALESVLLEELGMRGDTLIDRYREITVP